MRFWMKELHTHILLLLSPQQTTLKGTISLGGQEKRRKTLGSKCWKLEMKLQKKDVWKFIEKR